MDRRGDELLPGARLADDQHARIRRRHALDHLPHALDREARSHHVAREPQVLSERLCLEPGAPELDRRAKREQHRLGRERLLEEVKGAELRGLHRVREPGAPAHHDHGHVGKLLPDRRQRAHPVRRSRHHEVQEHDVRLVLHRALHPRRAVRCLAHREPLRA